jgi:hypothetical protein
MVGGRQRDGPIREGWGPGGLFFFVAAPPRSAPSTTTPRPLPQRSTRPTLHRQFTSLNIAASPATDTFRPGLRGISRI